MQRRASTKRNDAQRAAGKVHLACNVDFDLRWFVRIVSSGGGRWWSSLVGIEPGKAVHRDAEQREPD